MQINTRVGYLMDSGTRKAFVENFVPFLHKGNTAFEDNPLTSDVGVTSGVVEGPDRREYSAISTGEARTPRQLARMMPAMNILRKNMMKAMVFNPPNLNATVTTLNEEPRTVISPDVEKDRKKNGKRFKYIQITSSIRGVRQQRSGGYIFVGIDRRCGYVVRTSCANSGRRGDELIKKAGWNMGDDMRRPAAASLDNAFTRHPRSPGGGKNKWGHRWLNLSLEPSSSRVISMVYSQSILTTSVIAIGAASYGSAFPVPTTSATHQNGMPIDLSHNGDVIVLDTHLSGSHAKAWRAVEVVRENFNARDLDAIVVKDNTGGDWRHHVPTSNEEEFEEKEESPHNVEILPVSVHIPSIAGMTQDPTPHCSAPPAEYSLPSQYPHNLIRGVKAIEYTSKEISVDFDEALYALKIFECNWTKFLDETDPGREIKRGNQATVKGSEGLCVTLKALALKRSERVFLAEPRNPDSDFTPTKLNYTILREKEVYNNKFGPDNAL
ncbi:hypothetical protein EV359DRAFT_66699 [Lentinula novae-zelandiae]|nr:hypothetical protein EV359DRAFT_66699 [Lentinula novae-zelandiae]